MTGKTLKVMDIMRKKGPPAPSKIQGMLCKSTSKIKEINIFKHIKYWKNTTLVIVGMYKGNGKTFHFVSKLCSTWLLPAVSSWSASQANPGFEAHPHDDGTRPGFSAWKLEEFFGFFTLIPPLRRHPLMGQMRQPTYPRHPANAGSLFDTLSGDSNHGRAWLE